MDISETFPRSDFHSMSVADDMRQPLLNFEDHSSQPSNDFVIAVDGRGPSHSNGRANFEHHNRSSGPTDAHRNEVEVRVDDEHNYHVNNNVRVPFHCHGDKQAQTDKVARNQLIAVCALCFLFMIGESIGGYLANSLALFTDVLHLGSDLIGFLISLLAIYLSTKPASKKMSFGYHRAEVLGALFSVFFIWLVSGVLCYIAVERIVKKHYKNVKADEMLVTASLGVVFNIIMGIVLQSDRCCKSATARQTFGHSHGGHGHSHSHHADHRETALLPFDDDSAEEIIEHAHKKHKNINVRAAFIHVIGDIIQSIGVLTAAVIIKCTSDEKYRLADPICTFLFSIIVLFTTVSVLRDTLRVILEGVPKELKYLDILTDLESIDGVEMAHGLHLWSLTIDKNAIAVHLAINDNADFESVLALASKRLQQRYDFYHCTVQVERYHHELMSSCSRCQEGPQNTT